MGTHVGALGLTLVAYWYARTRARDDAFSFGTGKVGALGGFASATGLAVVALLIFVESAQRLTSPVAIRFDEAIAMSRRGADLDPLSPIARADEGRALYYARRYDAAIEVFDEVLANGPDFVAGLYKGLALAESARSTIPSTSALTSISSGRSLKRSSP